MNDVRGRAGQDVEIYMEDAYDDSNTILEPP